MRRRQGKNGLNKEAGQMEGPSVWRKEEEGHD